MRVLKSLLLVSAVGVSISSAAMAATIVNGRLYSGANDGALVEDFSTSSLDLSLQRTFANAGRADSTYNGVGRVTADQTSVKAFASVELTNYLAGSYTSINGCDFGADQCAPDGGPVTLPASVGAIQSDTLTISGGTGVGYYQFEFDITGSGSFSTDLPLDPFDFDEPRGASASGSLSFNDTTNSNFDVFGFTGAGTFTTDVFAFNYDESFELSLFSDFSFNVDDFVGSELPDGSLYNFSGIADFENTIILKSISIFEDAAAQRLANDVSLSSVSGANYNLVFDDASEVPLPAAMPMFLAGALGFSALRRRKAAAS